MSNFGSLPDKLLVFCKKSEPRLQGSPFLSRLFSVFEYPLTSCQNTDRRGTVISIPPSSQIVSGSIVYTPPASVSKAMSPFSCRSVTNAPATVTVTGPLYRILHKAAVPEKICAA